MTYLSDIGADNPLKPLQVAACTYRIALGPRAGREVLSVCTVASRDEKARPAGGLCAEAHSFSLHAAIRCAAYQRMVLERLCRYITRQVIVNGGFPELATTAVGRLRLLVNDRSTEC
jgi:hypothetical protein